jgi:4-amino-4-deoxy-L-arabinose transferase-like glycosyltransferase
MLHWSRGEFQYYYVNPPLVRLVATVPASIFPGVEYESRVYHSIANRAEFIAGNEYIKKNGVSSFSRFRWGRIACIPFSILGGIVSLLWARQLYGDTAALIALALWSFSPTILAYGSLIVPDLGATSIGLLANYVFWRWLTYSTWKLSVAVGVCLGLAQLTKFTWLVLFGAWPIIWLVVSSANRRPVWREARQLAFSFLLCIYVINLGYGFEGSLCRLADVDFHWPMLSGQIDGDQRMVIGNRFNGSWLGEIPVPLPLNYVTGIDDIRSEFFVGARSYLRGQWQDRGWWYYYLYGLAIKLPLGVLLLILVAAIVSLFRKEYFAGWVNEVVLVIPAVVVLLLVSLNSGISHHIRYALPALPYLFIWSSKVGKSFAMHDQALAVLSSVAITWAVSSSLWVYPHSFSYFNELAGGPLRGHFHLGSSNTDWGQDLLYIKKWYDEHSAARPFHLGYELEEEVDPAIVGIHWEHIPHGPIMNRPGTPRARHWPWSDESIVDYKPHSANNDGDMLGPLPGWYAIGVNRLHRLHGRHEYLLDFDPVDYIGYSTFVYHISVEQANDFRRRMGMSEIRNLSPPH